jgi:hypothetical protein
VAWGNMTCHECITLNLVVVDGAVGKVCVLRFSLIPGLVQTYNKCRKVVFFFCNPASSGTLKAAKLHCLVGYIFFAGASASRDLGPANLKTSMTCHIVLLFL